MTTDPRTAYALPARIPGASNHQQGRPAPRAAVPAPDPGSYAELARLARQVTVLFVPDYAGAQARARVLAQLAEGSRRSAERRASQGRP